MVRAYLIFGGNGPILVVTQHHEGLQSERARFHLENKGIRKYIAFEVPLSRAREIYGSRLDTAVERLVSPSDIRVVDMNGDHVFANFNFNEMGEPVFVDGTSD
ncbi:MAG: cytosolic protein [Magnetococcales bacterium]|nr:cytosolic protein [Magnetococcales bacterium]